MRVLFGGRSRRGALVFALALPLALVLALPAGSVTRRGPRPRVRHVSLLYVVNAGGGTLRPLPGRRFVLTLRRLERHGVWFSDSPAHRSGVFPSGRLAAGWKGLGFVSHPPNAALVYPHDPGSDGSTIILQLGPARYMQRGNAISFTARWIEPRTVRSPNLIPHAKDADPTPPRSFTDSSLFIDDGTAPVINGCIIQPYTQCDGVDLHGADLHAAALSYADLAGTNLNGATLAGADLSYADLATAKLQIADLAGANLSYANLAFGDFPGASFGGANLTGANLSHGVDTAASYGGAKFCNTTMPDGSINNINC